MKAEFINNSKSDTYKVRFAATKDNTLIADAFELAAGKNISTLTLLEAPEFGNVDCTVTITAYRDGKQIGSMHTELTLHTAYLWPKEVLMDKKKLITFLLALTMILSLTAGVSAAETTEARVPVTLTVVNTVSPISCTVPAASARVAGRWLRRLCK